MTSPTDSRNTVRFGLVGCGDIGLLRAAALAESRGCRLVAVADSDASKATNLASRRGCAVESSWRTLVQRDDIDAVIISTPPISHAEIGEGALEAGKDVLVEKPLARTSDECRRLVAAAERTGRRLATGFNYRFYPSFSLARSLLDSGIIGELDHVRSYAGYSVASAGQAWVRDGTVVGGGALRDIGIHLIDLTRDYLGDVVEVMGHATNNAWGLPGAEDNGFLLLRSSRGNVATLHASWSEWRRYQFRVELYGTRGCIRATAFPMLTQVVWTPATGGPSRRKTHFFARTALGEKLKSYRWVVVQSFIKEHAAFCAYLRGEPSRVATGSDGLRAVEIAEQGSQPIEGGVADGRADARLRGTTRTPLAGSTDHQSASPLPALSVVVIMFTGPEHLRRCLRGLLAQRGVSELEIVVPHDDSLSDAAALATEFPRARFARHPGRHTPAELRARGVLASSAPVVAVIEDHCVPSDEWAARLLEAHREGHAAVGGSVEKGFPPGRTSDTALNWAFYLADYSRYMLPLPAGAARTLTDCNVSYKRSALDAIADVWSSEFHENLVNDTLMRERQSLWFEPRMTVHEQRTLGIREALRDRYTFGRLFGSSRLSDAGLPRRAAMAAVALAMPPLLIFRIVRTLSERGRHRDQILRCLPSLILITSGWMLGEAVGYITGRPSASLSPSGYKQSDVGSPAEHEAPART